MFALIQASQIMKSNTLKSNLTLLLPSFIEGFVTDRPVRHHNICKIDSNHFIHSDLLKECEKV